jgi:hypothetical protein
MIPTWLIGVALGLLVGSGLLLLRLWGRRRPTPADLPEPTEGVEFTDLLASLWVQGRYAEGLDRTHRRLAQPVPDAERQVLHRWLARWAAVQDDTVLLRRALENRPWPEPHPEADFWRLRTQDADLQAWMSAWDRWQTAWGPTFTKRLLERITQAGRHDLAWRVWHAFWAADPGSAWRIADPVEILRHAGPQALEAGRTKEARAMADWLQRHRPDHPLGYWLAFQVERAQRFTRPERHLVKGIERTDHYWLYRTLEGWWLDRTDPQAVQSLYVRRVHETGGSLRTQTMLLLHYIHVERLDSARALLESLQERLQEWPPYWMWLGYVAQDLGLQAEASAAWRQFWYLVRRTPDHVHPFVCEVCGFGIVRWWEFCPHCHRRGTLNLRLPPPSPSPSPTRLEEEWMDAPFSD